MALLIWNALKDEGIPIKDLCDLIMGYYNDTGLVCSVEDDTTDMCLWCPRRSVVNRLYDQKFPDNSALKGIFCESLCQMHLLIPPISFESLSIVPSVPYGAAFRNVQCKECYRSKVIVEVLWSRIFGFNQ